MTNGQTQSSNTNKIKWILDVLIFLGFLIAMEPGGTGLPIHEWFTLAELATTIIHLLLNWDWLAQTTRRLLGKISGRTRTNYILNWLLFIDGILLMLSGILISRAVVPALGIQLPEAFAWRRLHDMSANFGLLLLGLHTALHWSWIVNAFNAYLVQPIARIIFKKDVTA